MISPEQFRAQLSERYGIATDRLDLRPAEALLASLDCTQLDAEALEARLVAATVNGESHFLRHHEQFEWLAAQWLATAVARARAAGRPRLRVLSAGCSTGEEPYSIAAVLAPLLPADVGLDVLAIDVSERALAIAEAGNYRQWSLRPTTRAYVGPAPTWMRVEDDRIVVRDWVKRPVRFVRYNLLEPLIELGKFDLVLCRNAMIYFHASAVKQVWRNLAQIVDADGTLLISPSDPPPRERVGLVARWHGDLCVYVNEADAIA